MYGSWLRELTTMRAQYEADFYGWTQVQADMLRSGALAGLDIPHLIEEIEDMGRSEQRALTSRLEILLAHLLKWQYQPDLHPRSWSLTIKEQRRKIVRHLQKNPSLNAQLADIIEDAYGDAIIYAERETHIPSDTFPPTCPWTWDEIVNPDFLPG